MSKIKTCEVNNKLIPLQASKDLLARISLVAQNRSIDPKTIFQYPLGPLPWSLAEPMGTLKKTSKVSLLHKLEGKTETVREIDGRYAHIFDGMAYVQQSRVSKITFGEFAQNLLSRISSIGKNADRMQIDVVFDEYKEFLISNK